MVIGQTLNTPGLRNKQKWCIIPGVVRKKAHTGDNDRCEMIPLRLRFIQCCQNLELRHDHQWPRVSILNSCQENQVMNQGSNVKSEQFEQFEPLLRICFR